MGMLGRCQMMQDSLCSMRGLTCSWNVPDQSLRAVCLDILMSGVCRVNSINGLPYKNDPAVFSWNIVNEPRCALSGDTDDSCKAGIQGFIDSMATFIKGIDKNHMVSRIPIPGIGTAPPPFRAGDIPRRDLPHPLLDPWPLLDCCQQAHQIDEIVDIV